MVIRRGLTSPQVNIAAQNYTDALKEGLIYRKERGIDCSDIATIAKPEHATFCQEPLDFIDGYVRSLFVRHL